MRKTLKWLLFVIVGLGLTTFGAYGDEACTGVVEGIDTIGKYVKLRGPDGLMWIPFGDIVHIAPVRRRS